MAIVSVCVRSYIKTSRDLTTLVQTSPKEENESISEFRFRRGGAIGVIHSFIWLSSGGRLMLAWMSPTLLPLPVVVPRSPIGAISAAAIVATPGIVVAFARLGAQTSQLATLRSTRTPARMQTH